MCAALMMFCNNNKKEKKKKNGNMNGDEEYITYTKNNAVHGNVTKPAGQGCLLLVPSPFVCARTAE